MRIFGLVGLLVAFVIVGLLAKKQFVTIAAPDAAPVDAREQSRQVQEQYKRAVDAAMQTRRQMPDDN